MKTSSFNTPELVRVMMGGLFMFMGIMKGRGLADVGLDPYREYVHALGLPEFFVYYGVSALLIELLLVVGLWVRPLFTPGVIMAMILISAGVIVGVYSLVLRISSDCGCGLLGKNEYGLLAQKLLFCIALVYLYQNRKRLNF